MKNYLILFASFIGFTNQSKGQDVQQVLLDAHNMNLDGSCFVYKMAIPQDVDLRSVKIKEQSFGKRITQKSDSLLQGMAPFEYKIGIERKRKFLIAKIPAFKKEENGQFAPLEKCILTIETAAASKSNSASGRYFKKAANSSVLSDGNWQKLAVKDRGIYKIDYNFVKTVLGQTGVINSAQIRLFGNGGTMLYEANSIARYDDLQENAIAVYDGGDGVFGDGDYFLFYANGPLEWAKDSVNQQFHHRTNLYADSSYYFISFNGVASKRVSIAPAATGTATVLVNSYNEYDAHEKELVNLGQFGKTWWGETFGFSGSLSNNQDFNFTVDALSDTIYYKYRLAAAAIGLTAASKFTVSLNGSLLGVHDNIYGIAGSDGEDPGREVGKQSFVIMPSTGALTFNIDYQKYVSEAKGYLDYIEWNARRQLKFNSGQQLSFRDWRSVGAGAIANFTLSNANNTTQIWDVTNALEPQKVNGNISGTTLSFTQNADRLKEYIAFDNGFYTPKYLGVVANQNLHGLPQAEYIIIHHSEMKEAAEKLANYHRNENNLRVHVVPIDIVYNEFASGAKDISAIRDFMKMFYDRAAGDESQLPKYLLLMGQASYDYKNILPGNPKIVPTYETEESLNATNGYCSDDYYAILDSTEDINSGFSMMDIGVGRIPATSASQALAVVDKILRYKSANALGDWRLNNLYLGDNEDGAGNHLLDADSMCKIVAGETDIYKAQKVYLDNMKFVSTPGGQRCPDANKIINDNVKKGTFLMNYNGHGSIYTLAHERIVTQDDFNAWNNQYKLPIMITATCDFSRFDNPALPSAGEKIILKSDGGAIALITTTQVVYASLNLVFNSSYLKTQFSKKSDGWYSFGEAFVIAKNNAPSANTRKFALLGDPAMIPNFPRYEVKTDSMLSLTSDGATAKTDSIKSLGSYRIYATVRDDARNIMTGFNGKASVTIYDKNQKNKVVTANSSPNTRSYDVQNNVIFKGNVSVKNGELNFEFISPKDINYDFGHGKIIYYADNGTIDAAGADTTAVVGGFAEDVIVDEDAPIVKVFMNDSMFRVGGLTGNNSSLYAIITDNSGINVSGNFVGHDLVAVLDNNIEMPYIINDYYETAPNTYKIGYVNFPMTGLSDGIHHIRVKAWDVFNNSGEGSTLFEVLNGDIVKIQKVSNYPNPFKDQTHFLFEHNHPNEQLTATVNIYSTSGVLMRTIVQDFLPTGSNSAEIIWDGTGNGGEKLAPGVYPYRIRIATGKNFEDLGYQKVVLTR